MNRINIAIAFAFIAMFLICTGCSSKSDCTDKPTNVLHEDIELSNGAHAVRTSTVYVEGEEKITYTVVIETENKAVASFMISVYIPDEDAAKDMLDVSEEEWQYIYLEGMNNVLPL